MEVERRAAAVARLRWMQTVRITATADARIRHELPEIDAALRRVAEGAYGLCEACGTQIVPERLELLPATPHCIDCAGKEASPSVSSARHPTVPAGHVRGDQVRFVTEGELADLLRAMLRGR